MKKFISAILILCMITTAVISMTSCDGKKLETVNDKTVLDAVTEAGSSIESIETGSLKGSGKLSVSSDDEEYKDEKSEISFTFSALKKDKTTYVKITVNVEETYDESGEPETKSSTIETWIVDNMVYFIDETGKKKYDSADFDISSLLSTSSTGSSSLSLFTRLADRDAANEQWKKTGESLFEGTVFVTKGKGYTSDINFDGKKIVSGIVSVFNESIGKPLATLMSLFSTDGTDYGKLVAGISAALEKFLNDIFDVKTLNLKLTFDEDLKITNIENKLDVKVSLTDESAKEFSGAIREALGMPDGEEEEEEEDESDLDLGLEKDIHIDITGELSVGIEYTESEESIPTLPDESEFEEIQTSELARMIRGLYRV